MASRRARPVVPEPAGSIPHRSEGEAGLLALLPPTLGRVLDLGCGDGRLMALVRAARPGAWGIAMDFSPTMLAAATEQFADSDVEVLDHDLDAPAARLGAFEAVVSSFAIHHVDDGRKPALYPESSTGAARRPVPQPGARRLAHRAAARAVPDRPRSGPRRRRPSNLLAPVETQLEWLRDIGFEDVDCHWKWREMALLAGARPGVTRPRRYSKNGSHFVRRGKRGRDHPRAR